MQDQKEWKCKWTSIVSVRVYSVGLFAKVLLGQIVFWFAEQPHLGIGGRITVH